MLATATGVTAEGEVDEGIFVAEAETVELRASEDSPSPKQGFESGVGVGLSVAVAETVEVTVSEGASEPLKLDVAVAKPPSAKRLESKLAACSAESVSVTDGSVVVNIDESGVVINGISVAVPVTTD